MNQSSLFFRRRGMLWRRDFLSLGIAAGLSACTPPKVKDGRMRHAMGERVVLGPLTFNVLETRWESSLGTISDNRMPQRNFLLVRLSVTNGGGGRQGFPLLSVLSPQGDRYREEEDTKHVADPMGLIRILGSSETVFGWLLYDVPQNEYALELTDGNLENEKTALVELPLRIA